MSKKVIVTRPQAEALNGIILNMEQFEAIRAHVLSNGSCWARLDRAALNGMSAEDLISALVFDFEVEKTPHERLAEVYQSPGKSGISRSYITSMHSEGFRTGIKTALEFLGIEVTGVNV
ncbi:hypothetical protein NST83_01110 [Paenibacillus sp. FSL R10-2782]|uniref:hypothetical protein n=1 Tax=Paenibacillus sp. FSL R10-2782 TaxID=2954661 RepID=UPI0031583257